MSKQQKQAESFNARLTNEIKELDKDVTPDRDLWPGIEQALTRQTSTTEHSRNSYLAIAASVCVVSFIAWFSFVSGQNMQGAELVAALSKQHETQKQTLLIRFKDQPKATQNWQLQVEELDEAADAIKKALQQEPNNPALLKMLRQVYEQQMNLIERVNEPAWHQI